MSTQRNEWQGDIGVETPVSACLKAAYAADVENETLDFDIVSLLIDLSRMDLPANRQPATRQKAR